MVERRGEPRLAQEALAEALVLGELGRDQLERDRPLEREVGRAVDDAHAAAADHLLDAVARERRAGRERVPSSPAARQRPGEARQRLRRREPARPHAAPDEDGRRGRRRGELAPRPPEPLARHRSERPTTSSPHLRRARAGPRGPGSTSRGSATRRPSRWTISEASASNRLASRPSRAVGGGADQPEGARSRGRARPPARAQPSRARRRRMARAPARRRASLPRPTARRRTAPPRARAGFAVEQLACPAWMSSRSTYCSKPGGRGPGPAPAKEGGARTSTPSSRSAAQCSRAPRSPRQVRRYPPGG